MKELILIRGLPGSGKSTLAKDLRRDTDVIMEADTYFLDEEGNYNFNKDGLYAAHNWCQRQTEMYLQLGCRVIVANTFTTLKELKPYFQLAKEFGIVPIVYHCQNDFGSIHDVPEETIERMKTRWTHDLTPLFYSLTENQ